MGAAARERPRVIPAAASRAIAAASRAIAGASRAIAGASVTTTRASAKEMESMCSAAPAARAPGSEDNPDSDPRVTPEPQAV
jgi:hypothetical protein